MNTFDLLNANQYKELYVTLLDNGGDEYPRMGIGKDSTGVFVVDMDDTGDPIRVKTYVKPSLNVMDVVDIGIKAEVFQAWASDDIRFRVDEDLQSEWDEFCNEVFA